MKDKPNFQIKTQKEYIQSENDECVVNFFENAKEIKLYDDGKSTTYQKGDDKYNEVMKSLLIMTKGSRPMPAFAVSLDEETRIAMKKGFWIELVFENQMTSMEMSFEALLIEVKKDYTGLNIIRKYDGKFQGRCFYLDMENDMSGLLKTIENISHKKTS